MAFRHFICANPRCATPVQSCSLGEFILCSRCAIYFTVDMHGYVTEIQRPWTEEKPTLFTETIELLKAYSKTPTDVRWVGSKDGKYSISWDAFIAIGQVQYRNGYGGQEIARDLVIVGDGWWLQREIDQGYEWWDFQTMPTPVVGSIPFAKLKTTHGSRTIDDLESEAGKLP